jgi:hypothetical protein
MHRFAESITTTPTTAEQRPPVVIPAPCVGVSKALRKEFVVLQARADSLETDKSHASLHRADFVRELDALTEVAEVEAAAPKGKPKTARQSVAEETGVVDLVADKAIGFEALQIRDIAIGLLRKEFALRSDVDGYLERRLSEGRKAEIAARAKLEETEADIQSKQELVGDKTIHVNRREIEELKSLIRFEAARLAGLSGRRFGQ